MWRIFAASFSHFQKRLKKIEEFKKILQHFFFEFSLRLKKKSKKKFLTRRLWWICRNGTWKVFFFILSLEVWQKKTLPCFFFSILMPENKSLCFSVNYYLCWEFIQKKDARDSLEGFKITVDYEMLKNRERVFRVWLSRFVDRAKTLSTLNSINWSYCAWWSPLSHEREAHTPNVWTQGLCSLLQNSP